MRAAHRLLPRNQAPMLMTMSSVTCQANRGAAHPGAAKSSTPTTADDAAVAPVSARDACERPRGAGGDATMANSCTGGGAGVWQRPEAQERESVLRRREGRGP